MDSTNKKYIVDIARIVQYNRYAQAKKKTATQQIDNGNRILNLV